MMPGPRSSLEAARQSLANIVLRLAKDSSRDPEPIKTEAVRLPRSIANWGKKSAQGSAVAATVFAASVDGYADVKSFFSDGS